jgi:ribosomal protein L35AE/L33A
MAGTAQVDKEGGRKFLTENITFLREKSMKQVRSKIIMEHGNGGIVGCIAGKMNS